MASCQSNARKLCPGIWLVSFIVQYKFILCGTKMYPRTVTMNVESIYPEKKVVNISNSAGKLALLTSESVALFCSQHLVVRRGTAKKHTFMNEPEVSRLPLCPITMINDDKSNNLFQKYNHIRYLQRSNSVHQYIVTMCSDLKILELLWAI